MYQMCHIYCVINVDFTDVVKFVISYNVFMKHNKFLF